MFQVRIIQIEGNQFLPHLLRRDESVLQHLGIARTDVLCIQTAQEFCVEDDKLRIIEYTYLILQSVEVDARLAANRCIHHSKQRGRDIDEVDAAFEGGSSKTAEVSHHAATEIDEARVS